MVEVAGYCRPDLELIRKAFQRNFDENLEVGASLALTLDGELVVDLWGGWSDEHRTRPWEETTITNCWSTTKLIAALCMFVLADAADVGLSSPVSRYWPEFAGAGKEEITLRQVLSHTSGVAGWDRRVRVADLYDWEKMTALLEDQAPWWIPGSASGYHAFTGGYILGEVVRRVTGRTMGEFFRDEIGGPLGIDLHLGLPAEHDDRVSHVLWPMPPDIDPASWGPEFAFAARANPILTGAEPWDPAWRRAEIPAANGHGNAKSLAMANSILACRGSLGGRAFFSEQLADSAFEVQSSGADLVLDSRLRWGCSYAIPGEDASTWVGPASGYWGGWGGSLVIVDLARRMSLAYVMNRMENKGMPGEDPRARSLTVAAHACLGALP